MNTFFYSLGLTITAFFIPVVPLMIIVGIFVLADTIFGIANSIFHKRRITSLRLASIIYKLLVYQAVLLLGYSVDVLILGGVVAIWTTVPLLITKCIASLIVFIESFSIEEKIRSMNKNKGARFYIKKSWKALMEGKEMFDKLKKDES